ncbi:MAG TPA: PCI domain-containing protein [Spirochaetota bacterium]|nr:PCI domain-containing protein [Spirochaetota bacterium]HPJ41010.1 PCI domain-containing protein [Spirochaetota bacterium]
MKFLFFIKDTVKKTAGVILFVFGVLMLLISIFGFITDYSMNKPEGVATAVIFMGFSICLIIPAVALFRSGQKHTQREERLKQLVSLIKAYRRISIAEISRNLGIGEMDARELVNTAISLDMIKGYMDRNTDEFFIDGSESEVRTLHTCPNCGARVEQILHKGETGKCSACGSIFR